MQSDDKRHPQGLTVEQMARALASPPAEKLTASVATKVSDELAWRIRQLAQAQGMTDAQILRLVLVRFDALVSAHYDGRVSLAWFIDQLNLSPEQLSLFFSAAHGEKRFKR